ncbi:MAG: alpha/beta hydrolase [Bacteroidota bacterium]
MRKLLIVLAIPLLLILVYLAGPRPVFKKVKKPEITVTAASLLELEQSIKDKEAQVENIKENNEARIVWADSARQTEYVLVYIHGFSASPMEGNPTHYEFAKRYGMNMYIARLAQHGIDNPESFVDLTPQDLIESAQEAIEIGRKLGKKMILMSCSTGSTLSIYLAAQDKTDIAGLIMYSPNIQLFDPMASLMTMPWGDEITHAILGDYRDNEELKGKEGAKYSTVTYRSEGVIALQSLLDQTMQPAVFQKIEVPYLIVCYYKNEEEQDPTVSVQAMRDFMTQTATPDDLKRLTEVENAKTHVIPSGIYCKDLEAVHQASYSYAEEVLGLVPVSMEPVMEEEE